MFELSSNFLFEPFEFLEEFEPGSNVFFEPVRTFGRFEPLWFEPPKYSNRFEKKVRTEFELFQKFDQVRKKVRTRFEHFLKFINFFNKIFKLKY